MITYGTSTGRDTPPYITTAADTYTPINPCNLCDHAYNPWHGIVSPCAGCPYNPYGIVRCPYVPQWCPPTRYYWEVTC